MNSKGQKPMYLNKSLVVLLLHLVGSNPVEPLIIINTGRVIVDWQGLQGHVHAIQPNVDAELRVDLFLGERSVGGGYLGLGCVPPAAVLAHQDGSAHEQGQGDACKGGEPLPPHTWEDDKEGQEQGSEHDVENEGACIGCDGGTVAVGVQRGTAIFTESVEPT